MTTVSITHPREPAIGNFWWVFLITGILWILFGLFVLDVDADSAVAIGYLVGFWLFFGGAAEFAAAALAPSWKWVHAVLGVLFVVGGVMALMSPFQTFTVLASLMSFFLVLKGTFDFVIALLAREELDLWWLTMIGGILQILLGIWAAGYPGRSAALLVLWIGVGAIMRGIVEITLSFQVKQLPKAVMA
jgi:hypothetical protein